MRSASALSLSALIAILLSASFVYAEERAILARVDSLSAVITVPASNGNWCSNEIEALMEFTDGRTGSSSDDTNTRYAEDIQYWKKINQIMPVIGKTILASECPSAYSLILTIPVLNVFSNQYAQETVYANRQHGWERVRERKPTFFELYDQSYICKNVPEGEIVDIHGTYYQC